LRFPDVMAIPLELRHDLPLTREVPLTSKNVLFRLGKASL